MAGAASDAMIEQLLSAGQRAIRHHLEGESSHEHEALEFMDSLWDQMSNEAREQALARLRESGLEEFAARIAAERRSLEEDA